jgi:putative phage-type endonuclease
MTGRLVVHGDAPRADWLAARRQGVTASEIAVVLGLSPYGSPFELFHRKTGALPPSPPDNEAMALGRYLEDYVVQQFAGRHPDFTVTGNGEALYAHPDRPWQMASPDRLVEDGPSCGIIERDGVFHVEPVAVLETKTSATHEDWGEDGTGEIPVHYRCQVLWQLDVMQVTAAYVACLFLHTRKVRVYQLAMDDGARADLKVMRSAARRFLERIDHGDEPDVDWRPATTGALKALHPEVDDGREVLIGRQLAISYRAAVRRFKDAEQRKDEMANRVLAAMGTAQHAVERGTLDTVASRSVSHPRRVSATLLRERHPAIAAECTPPPKPVIKLTPARAKKRKTS